MSTPPTAGTRLTVRVDDLLADDLAVLMRTRCATSDTTWSASDAVRRAVEVLAQIHRGAWATGAVLDRTEPHITSAQLAPSDTQHTTSDAPTREGT